MAINSALFTPRAACWALALLASWQLMGTQGAAADEILPAPVNVVPQNVVVVEPGITQGAPRLLYALDGNQMSMAELRPGTMDPQQLSTYLSMMQVPVDLQAAMADPTMVMMAMIGHAPSEAAPENVAALGGADLPGGVQTAAAVEYTSEIMPRSYKDADGSWVFPRLPDVDEREVLSLDKWRVEENPESQALFLGPDRRFGWDDFADLINPLQHLPLINIAYREITGDKIYGAARLLDFGFGPVAGVSTVADLAVTDMTGSSMSDHAVAAVFGREAAPSNLDNLAYNPDAEIPQPQVQAQVQPQAQALSSAPASYTATQDAFLVSPLSHTYYPEAAQLAAYPTSAPQPAAPSIVPALTDMPQAAAPVPAPRRGSSE
jgi:hypothetical protein